jgi:hypothetical protein
MQPYTKTTLSFVIKPKGDPIYSEMATVVGMRDDAGGPYVSISQCYDCKETGEIRLCEEEWPLIKRLSNKCLKNAESKTRKAKSKTRRLNIEHYGRNNIHPYLDNSHSRNVAPVHQW